MGEKKKYKTVDEILSSAYQSVRGFVAEMDRQNVTESRESINDVVNRIKGETERTEIKKRSFIEEIKSGLGEEVKKKGNRVTYIKKTRTQKVKEFFRRLFSTL